jgi:hypothetical protein
MSKQADEVKSWRLNDAYAVPGFRVFQRLEPRVRTAHFRADVKRFAIRSGAKVQFKQ